MSRALRLVAPSTQINQSQIISASIMPALGAAAEITRRSALGQPMTYDETTFTEIIRRYGIGHNAALSTLEMG